MPNLRRRRLLLATTLLLGGCAAVGPATFRTWQVEAPADDTTMSFQGVPVRTGQIVVSEQGSPNSLFLSLLVAENHPFVHSGIIVIENGTPMVYEANGRMQPALLHRSLTSRVVGSVRRLELGTFLQQNRFVSIYEPPPGADGLRIGRFAQDSLVAGVPFDAFFDRNDPSKVYCSEFTALALAAGGVSPPRTSPMNPNASVALVLDWLHITTPDIIPPANLTRESARVGLFSRDDNGAQVEAYFAAKAELHRRFTPEQKLGNVLHFSTLAGLKFQPEVAAFLAAANGSAAGWAELPAPEIDRRVRALAEVHLGAFDPEVVAGQEDTREGVVIAAAPH